MRICSISPRLTPAFEALGHEVLHLWPEKPGLLDIKQKLEAHGFAPDLLIQQECLGPRTLLQGLAGIECPKIFWSLDSHLNTYWHRHYARLFDGVATPHMSLFSGNTLRRPTVRLPMPGVQRPWRSHSDRSKDIAFVGRFSEHRPLRTMLADFLRAVCRNDFLAIEQELSFADMLALYDDARLVPNESIAREVNFRLMEAASCGALVLSQDVGEDQDVLFTPDKEIDVYHHVLELQSLIEYYRARPDAAERKARAAWERVQKEHLPVHRAQQVIDFAANLPGSAAHGDEARRAMHYTQAEMHISGMMRRDPDYLLANLADHSDDPYALALTLRILAASGRLNELRKALQTFLASDGPPTRSTVDTLDADLACSMAGLRLDDFGLARFCWLSRQKRLPKDDQTRCIPESPNSLCRAWADELARAGIVFHPGQYFEAGRHLPASAVHCLFLAHSYDRDDKDTSNRLGNLLSQVKGFDYLQLAHLSDLSLRQRDNWRLHLSLGMVNLRCYRRDEGLEEILWARHKAQEQGKTANFERMLGSMDPHSTVLAALTRRQNGR